MIVSLLKYPAILLVIFTKIPPSANHCRSPFQIFNLVKDPVKRFTKTTIQVVSVALEQVVDVSQCHLSAFFLTCRTDLANLHNF